jgi:ADP-heptose:LPS heptosyltransferase
LLGNISPEELAHELLGHCLATGDWPGELLHRLTTLALGDDPSAATKALFGIVVERLGDLFEPRLCDVYARLFSEVCERALPGVRASDLVARYRRMRAVRPFAGPDPANIVVLSRVTLGADVAVTSVVMDALKRRFPSAVIWFAGNHKGWELFQVDPRLQFLPAPYQRGGSLRDRLDVWPRLRESLTLENVIVVDPDSRLTQLGLLPVCDDDRYYFFESRSYGGESDAPLSLLASQWAAEVFGVEGARAFIAPVLSDLKAEITVSLGVGENPAKRVGGDFESELLRALARRGESILIDHGAGGEESARVDAALKASGAVCQTWRGAYAPFASAISRSSLYAGYDSSSQHVAAACGIPLVTVFAGYPSLRMYHRWRPHGSGPIHVIRVDKQTPAEVLAEISSQL